MNPFEKGPRKSEQPKIKTCHSCGGTGKKNEKTCNSCHGSGKVRAD